MSKKLKRTIPYLRLLMVAPPQNRVKMLKSYPSFVVDDMVETLYNILAKNIKLRNPKYLKLIKSKRRVMSKLYKVARQPKERKKVILNQRGGFIGAIIPLIASALGGLASTAL